jgi:hypothetical protein
MRLSRRYPGYQFDLEGSSAFVTGPAGKRIWQKEFPDDTKFAAIVREAKAWVEENRAEHDKHLLEVIPLGCYCYDIKGVCPYFSRTNYPGFPAGSNAGKCSLLVVENDMLLDDQCKICNINDASHSFEVTLYSQKDGLDPKELAKQIEGNLAAGGLFAWVKVNDEDSQD